MHEVAYHLKLQGWVLNSLSNLVGVLEGLECLAEAGQLQVDTSHGEMHVARRPTLVALVVQGMTRVSECPLQASQTFVSTGQVQVRFGAEVRAVCLFCQAQLSVSEFKCLPDDTG
jgi:hypothetical protein